MIFIPSFFQYAEPNGSNIITTMDRADYRLYEFLRLADTMSVPKYIFSHSIARYVKERYLEFGGSNHGCGNLLVQLRIF